LIRRIWQTICEIFMPDLANTGDCEDRGRTDACNTGAGC
jgi:hypothetical protein